MNINYYSDTDTLYIELKNAPGTESREIVAGLAVDLDANGDVVGFNINQVLDKLDLSHVETVALPPMIPAGRSTSKLTHPGCFAFQPLLGVS